MAGDAVIGALRVVLGMDTAQLEDGAKKASDNMKKFGRDVAAVTAGLQLDKFIQKITDSFTHLIRSSVETADNMGKMSQRIGVSVESLSTLTAAAAISDVGVEALGKSMAKLAKTMTGVAAGEVNEAASAFQFLGISAKQLSSLTPDQVIERMAESFSKMKDGADKTAIAMAIFGSRIGTQMIPLLNTGAKGLQEMRENAVALGLVFTTQTTKQAETFVDSIKLMGLGIQGVGNVVAAYFLPQMSAAAKSMQEWVVQSNLVWRVSEIVIRTIMFLVDNVKIFGALLLLVFGAPIVNSIIAMGVAILAMGKAMAVAAIATLTMATRMFLLIGAVTLVAGAVLALTGNLEPLLQKLQESKDKFDFGVVGDTVQSVFKAMGLDVKAFEISLGDARKAAEAASKSLAEVGKNKFDPKSASDMKAFADEIARVNIQTRELQGLYIGLAPNFVQAAISAKLFKDQTAALNFDFSKMTPQMLALNDALAKFRLAQIKQEDLTPWQLYQQEILKLNALLPKTSEELDLVADRSAKAAAKMAQSYAEMASTFVGGFAQLFQALGQKNKSMFTAWKALATAEAIISTYAGAAKALAIYGPTPVGFAMAASAVAAGLANVIKIQQTQFTGAAKGGTFRVPGGIMGVDTKMVSMALSPGELVKVTPAEEARTTGGGAQEIQLRGIRPGDLFTGEMVRSLFETLNQGYSDGYRLKVVT